MNFPVTYVPDLIAMACEGLLARDTLFSEHVNGKIYRQAVLYEPREAGWPCAVVAVYDLMVHTKTAHRVNVVTKVGIYYCFEEFNRALPAGEPSAVSVQLHMLSLLTAARVQRYIGENFPQVPADAVEQISYFQGFAPVPGQPIKGAKDGKDVAFAVGLESLYDSRVGWPSFMPVGRVA